MAWADSLDYRDLEEFLELLFDDLLELLSFSRSDCTCKS